VWDVEGEGILHQFYSRIRELAEIDQSTSKLKK